jgi:hypothetical protein
MSTSEAVAMQKMIVNAACVEIIPGCGTGAEEVWCDRRFRAGNIWIRASGSRGFNHMKIEYSLDIVIAEFFTQTSVILEVYNG